MGPQPFRNLKTLYYGERAAERKDEIHSALRNKKPVPGLYFITFASNGIDQLDILPFYTVLQKRVTERRPILAGLCLGRQEAFETVRQIASDAYRETGTCDLQSFLLGQDAKRSVTV